MSSYICKFCWKVSFDNQWKLYGHRGRCSKRKEQIIPLEVRITQTLKASAKITLLHTSFLRYIFL